MNKITVIHVGDFKEKWELDAEKEYIKRISAFAAYKTVCIREESTFGEDSQALIDRALAKEAEAIRNAIPAGALKIALCIEGKQFSSEELAAATGECNRPVCFIIGSSHGLHPDIKKECDIRLSMSKMTFPHRMARIMLAEQVYRAFMINSGRRYHK